METPAPDAPARRRFLLGLMALGGVASLAAARIIPVFPRRTPAEAASIDPADRAVAAIAIEFARTQPEATRRIARAVTARLSIVERIQGPALRVCAARSQLLRPARIDAELAAGDVMLLSGWVLARSEAEFAIYALVESRA